MKKEPRVHPISSLGAFSSHSVLPLFISALCAFNLTLMAQGSGPVTNLTSAPAASWSSVASSADNKVLYAVSDGIFRSSDGGLTWTNLGLSDTCWNSVACSANGMRAVAVTGCGSIYTSADIGATWNTNEVPPFLWWNAKTSADGTKLIVCSQDRHVFTSSDFGQTWISNALPLLRFSSV